MTTLDDKLLGFKSQNYVSSSESEGEDEDDKSSGEDDSRSDIKVDVGDVAAPPDFRLEVPKVSLTTLELKYSIFLIVLKAKLQISVVAQSYSSLIFYCSGNLVINQN